VIAVLVSQEDGVDAGEGLAGGDEKLLKLRAEKPASMRMRAPSVTSRAALPELPEPRMEKRMGMEAGEARVRANPPYHLHKASTAAAEPSRAQLSSWALLAAVGRGAGTGGEDVGALGRGRSCRPESFSNWATGQIVLAVAPPFLQRL